MTRWVSCCPASPLDKKASQPVNRCHNATFVFSSVGKRIAWVYFNHSWPAVVAVLVKRQRRIKNTHRFVKFFLVIDKNFFFFAADGQFVGA